MIPIVRAVCYASACMTRKDIRRCFAQIYSIFSKTQLISLVRRNHPPQTLNVQGYRFWTASSVNG